MTQQQKEEFERIARHWAEAGGVLREDLLDEWDWQSQPTGGQVVAGTLPPSR